MVDVDTNNKHEATLNDMANKLRENFSLESAEYFKSPENTVLEEELRRNPYSVQKWCHYTEAAKEVSFDVECTLYQRALIYLPRSYKLWKRYLDLVFKHIRSEIITSPKWSHLCTLYEQALIHLGKMPRIWLDYAKTLMQMRKVTSTRRMFDRALRALPLSQHALIWPTYLKFVNYLSVKPTIVAVYSRYLMLYPEERGKFITVLETKNFIGPCCEQILHVLNGGKSSKYPLWMKLCELVSKFPEEVAAHEPRLDVDAILRSGISKFSDQVGRLWCALATYYIRSGLFERARDVYEEALEVVETVRDFSRIFEAYSKFEEEMLSAKMTLLQQQEQRPSTGEEENDDLDLRLARLEYLMSRRPLLLSSVLLRQNPHHVYEWQKRVQLVKKQQLTDDSNLEVLETYATAVQTIDPQLAEHGKLSHLWVDFAKYYETNNQLDEARSIFQRAVEINFKTVDDLATIFCEWSELEIRSEHYDEALALLRIAVEKPQHSKKKKPTKSVVQDRVYRNIRLWSAYLDLEESLGTLESTKSAYSTVMDLQLATVTMVLNYAAYLKSNQYFEDSFQVYERGIALFDGKFPHALPLWQHYLEDFTSRYRGTKVERTRDLFEQCLAAVPAKHASAFFRQYGQYEATFGLSKRAMSIYARAPSSVSLEDEFDMYCLWLAKVGHTYGLVETRPVFEQAVANLRREADIPRMCVQFAALELKLGEITRARVVWTHGSQFANPRVDEAYWQGWHEFEVSVGNELTYLDMLRVKRSVAAQYAHVMTSEPVESGMTNMVPATTTTATKPTNTTQADDNDDVQVRQDDPMAHLEESGNGRKRKPSDADEVEHELVVKQPKIFVEANPEEIDLDDLDEEEDMQVEEKAVPSAVFGQSLQNQMTSRQE